MFSYVRGIVKGVVDNQLTVDVHGVGFCLLVPNPEIFQKEKEVRDLQKRRFGYEGDLFKERQRLVKPIQDKVYNAIQKIAVAKAYDFVLDKSEGITVIFADPKLDKSDEILKEMGIRN